MAEFRVRDREVFRVSVPSADLDVKDGVVDLSGVDPEVLPAVEAELESARRAGLLLDEGERRPRQPRQDNSEGDKPSGGNE